MTYPRDRLQPSYAGGGRQVMGPSGLAHGGKGAIFGPMLGIFALRDHWEQILMRMFLDVPTAALQYLLEHKSGQVATSQSAWTAGLLAVAPLHGSFPCLLQGLLEHNL